MLPRSTIITTVVIATLLASSQIHAENITSRFSTYTSILEKKSIGEKISYWAEAFIGTPYDTDPLGKYVREEQIVADDAVDCMYLTFRSVELALSRTPEEAVRNALTLRFHGRGLIHAGRVLNYNDRYEYGEDMIDSTKFGKEITSEIGKTVNIRGSRGRDQVVMVPKDELSKISRDGVTQPLQDGDIIFFVKDPAKRVVGEIVGHIGIISIKEGIPYLIHAGGKKSSAKSKGSGSVKSVKLSEYIEAMGFIGARVTRFQ